MCIHRSAGRLVGVLLIAVLTLSPPTGQAWAQEDGSVRLTFELYLSGDVPGGEVFRLSIDAPPRRSGGSGTPPLYLCGGLRGELEASPGPEVACVGREEPYVGIAGGDTGATVRYRFYRHPAGRPDDAEVFSQGSVRLERNATIVAYYRFPGDDEPGVPSGMPDTGAGGLARGAMSDHR